MTDFVFVAGARPNFVKIAPILHAMEARGAGGRATVVHTGQHYDDAMSDVFFRQLDIREPDVHLGVGSGTHGAQTARIITAFEEYLLGRASPPSALVVVGDVNSTMACSLVGAKLHIPVVHVEAGLRSKDRRMPEEINRVVTDAIADLLLVSEPDGLRNLRAEGVPESRVAYVGNVMIDSLVRRLDDARELRVPAEMGLEAKGYALVTLHRPSNVDDPAQLARLVEFLERVGATLPVVFPVHPRTDARLRDAGLRERLARSEGISLLKPVGYLEILGLMESARLVISDSGGIQEETTYLRVPCITLRPSTERPVTASEGTNTIVGADTEAAWQLVQEVLGGTYKEGGDVEGWDGHAAERVVNELLTRYG